MNLIMIYKHISTDISYNGTLFSMANFIIKQVL
jgi:hypothetical protein